MGLMFILIHVVTGLLSLSTMVIVLRTGRGMMRLLQRLNSRVSRLESDDKSGTNDT
jgi:hypothetical protein